MEKFTLANLDSHSNVETLVNKLQSGLEEDLNSFQILHEGIELSQNDKLSTLLPYKNKEIFCVVCKVNREAKLIEIHADIEVQTFVFEENSRPKSFWTLNLQFYSTNEVAKFPSECTAWSRLEVDYWFQWAVGYFKLKQRDSLKIWDFDGKELCCTDPNIFEDETFRAHMKILCQFNLVCSPIKCLDSDIRQYKNAVNKFSKMQTVCSQPTSLWEFFLQLLIDKDCKDMIAWCDDKGKFKVLNSEKVSMAWGKLNENAHCTYDSIHNVIVKGIYKDYLVHVSGEKYTYQYVINISKSLGISPLLINQLRHVT